MDLSLQWPRAQAPTPATVAVPAAAGAVPAPPSSSNHNAQASIFGAPPLLSQHHPDAYLYHAAPQSAQHHYVTHPAAYSSHQHSSSYPNPNHNTYAYPYSDLNSATHIPSIAHASQHLADPYNHGPYASHGGHATLDASAYYYTGGGEPAAVPAVLFNRHVGSETHGSVYAYDLLRGGTSLPPSYIRLEATASRRKPPRREKKSSNLLKKKVLKVQKQATKVKVVQSAYCDACKIKCDTPDMLMLHKQGKKHKKNMQKLQESYVAELKAPQTVVENEPAVAEKEKNTEQKKKKHDPATVGDLEEKKRRLLEGGVAPKEIRVCLICNVAVNSEKVYDYHIAGQKHASMLKKKQELSAV